MKKKVKASGRKEPRAKPRERIYPDCPRCGKETFQMIGGGIMSGSLACHCGWQQFN